MKGLIRDIIVALVIVIAITMVIKPTIVKESSMQPTLYENNYLLVNKQAYRFGDEKRGDIIVFKSDLENENGDKKLLIKRIIGLPGDTITIQNGTVTLNGVQLQEDYTLEGETPGELIDFTVPEGKLFVMGDNRRVSVDSRSEEVGCVDESQVMGKAFVRLYPFNEIGGLY
ncbi:signal peptidase I [bacterium 210820-DFI.6.37]|nr:signal peptidase I [bacterium 210820-DFI.6.37]